MPQNGYWIECIPVSSLETDGDTKLKSGEAADLYRAEIASIPEARVTAKTPDGEIQQLRDKLASVRHDYCTRGKNLPEHDNPITPPRNNKAVRGWISIYVKMSDCCALHNST